MRRQIFPPISTGSETDNSTCWDGTAPGICSVMDRLSACKIHAGPESRGGGGQTAPSLATEEQQRAVVASARRRRANACCVTCEMRTGKMNDRWGLFFFPLSFAGDCPWIKHLISNTGKNWLRVSKWVLWKETIKQMESKPPFWEKSSSVAAVKIQYASLNKWLKSPRLETGVGDCSGAGER